MGKLDEAIKNQFKLSEKVYSIESVTFTLEACIAFLKTNNPILAKRCQEALEFLDDNYYNLIK
jgi:hypothetical protein